MNIGMLIIGNEPSVSKIPSAVFEAVRLLELKGHEVKSILTISYGSEMQRAMECARADVDAVIVTGNVETFRKQLSQIYVLQEEFQYFEIEQIIYLLDSTLSMDFILKTAIPALNSKCKTFYNSVVMKTFGLELTTLQERLVDCIHNKNRIVFRLIELEYRECEVRICFSKKTKDVNAMVARVSALLSDCIYSLKGESLAESVIAKLKQDKKTICTAESFTGGGVAGALVSVAGASAVLKEGIVAYSNASKIARLNVAARVLEECGAVSIEAAYEMAANALISSGCDYSIATTGNAGPSAEQNGQAGLFFVAVGSKTGIHVYQENCQADRATVIETGIKTALFRLYQNLCEESDNKKGEIDSNGEE